ncbi:MAG TPA: CHASE3 domain-containing protein [Alphaproteobacteria bacterium]|nr:CHASE3 domain-containing protein [Alphaproteobacteria bacterium]
MRQQRAITGALLGLLVLIGLLLMVGSLAYRASSGLSSTRTSVLQAYRVMDAARSLLSAVQDAETGQRGYLITGYGPFLRPYRDAQAQIGPRLAELRQLTAGDAQQMRQVAALEPLIEAKKAELAVAIDLRALSRTEDARRTLLESRGEALMDRIRGLLGTIVAEEQRRLVGRLEASERAEARTVATALLGAGIGIPALVIAGLLLRNAFRRLGIAQDQARRTAERLAVTLDTVSQGVAMFDAQGELRIWNRYLGELLGLEADRLRSGLAFDDLASAARARCGAAVLALPEGGGRASAEHALPGGRLLEVERRPLPDGGFVICLSDLTDRSLAEATRRREQRMEGIGQLTGGLAHDFNNLLTIVIGHLNLALRRIGDDKVRRAVESALKGADRAAALTNQLLAFARRQPLQLATVDLNQLVIEMGALLGRTLGETVSVRAVTAASLWPTHVDPAQVENAILNLALNARDAMPNGGTVTIETGNVTLDAFEARAHGDVRPGDYVTVAVRDEGTGMPPDIMERVFDPFFTTKPEGQGTGLGLSMVYGFVKQSRGHIQIDSAPGCGTTVRLYLPRAQAAPTAAAKPRAADDALPGGGETILVAEDNDDVRGFAVQILEDLGYAVLQAPTGDLALEMIEAGAPVDLLFTDVIMPGRIRGGELAMRARALRPGLPVLFTSGFTDNAILQDGRLDEGCHFLGKPYRPAEVARKVRAALDAAAGTRPAPVRPAVSNG